MALDVGSKRIGIAVSDPSATFALPVATIERTNRRDDLARMHEIVESYGVDELVVGDPMTLAGERGIAAREDGCVRRSDCSACFRGRFIASTSG